MEGSLPELAGRRADLGQEERLGVHYGHVKFRSALHRGRHVQKVAGYGSLESGRDQGENTALGVICTCMYGIHVHKLVG